MAMRTVRLDDEAEEALRHITQTTGLSIASALKQGLIVLRNQMVASKPQLPYKVFKTLDLGNGDDTAMPSTETRRGVQDAIRRKLGQ